MTVANPADPTPSKLARMLASCSDIGGVYNLTFDNAVVLTSDFEKSQSGGIAQGQWLLAAALDPSDRSLTDEEVVLLRVTGIGALPNERELVAGRMAVVRDAHATRRAYDEVIDVHTRAEHQLSAINCDVMGVFYTSVADEENVEFGAELDNVWSAAHYRVFMPSAKALSWIASYPRSEHSLDVGVVRFSATRRNAQKHGMDAAGVSVNVADFVGSKTAIFGLTRSGKSNTIKTLVTAVFQHAAYQGTRIGQIIFDPQSEYAKINAQDGTGLRLLGDADQVRIYSAAPTNGDPQERPLRLNFYDTALFAEAWDMVQSAMADDNAAYLRTFRALDMDEPDKNDHSAHNRWSRGYMAFYGLLYRAGYKGSFANSASIYFSMKQEMADAYNRDNPSHKVAGGSGQFAVTSPEHAAKVVDWFLKMKATWDKLSKSAKEEETEEASRVESIIESWLETDEVDAIAEVFGRAKGRGLAGLRELREFHDANSSGDLNSQVWDDMVNGRLVVIDLGIGSDVVTKTMSERLITALVAEAAARFRDGLEPIPFQVVVEEAHNLFERGRDAKDDPWVKMSKEASKYKIGLVYATQEVTSVDQRILSNTHNWVIANLNSDTEIRELSKYYNFGDFGASIKRAEDKGYVRIKTMSSPFIVPVQVAKFDHAMVNRARTAAGLVPLSGFGQATTVLAAVDSVASKPRRISSRHAPKSGDGPINLGDGEF